MGVTNSKGFVLEYDSSGLHRHKTLDWNQCIVIELKGAVDPDVINDPDWPEYWDACLENTAAFWTGEPYEAQDNNCFAFVLAFLRSLKQNPLSMSAHNKVDFCTQHVLPKTTLAGKYICLYRRIKSHQGSYVTQKKTRNIVPLV